MTSTRPFRTTRRDEWAKADDVGQDGDVEETEEEAREYDDRVAAETSWKVDGDRPPAPSGSAPARMTTGPAGQAEHIVPPRLDHPESPEPPEHPGHPGPSAESIIDPLPSFNRSHIVNASTPHLKGYETYPNVPTPSAHTTPLPAGPPKRALTGKARSPDHIPSPINTPSTSTITTSSRIAPAHAEGKGKRTGPGTPLPLGSTTAFSSWKGKRDYQTLTRHFELFNRNVAKHESQVEASTENKDKGKARVNKAPSAVGLGGKVFEGLRFCIPPELGQVGKHKQRWDIISRLGGQVTLQPDTTITHVIYDRPSASILCRKLGLQTLSQLPEGTVCVKWDWVVNCKLAGRVLDTASWLSFPINTLTRLTLSNRFRASSRSTDITDQLRGKNFGISKKREYTASESDTESPKRPQVAPAILALATPNSSIPSMAQTPVDSSKSVPCIATSHALPFGPGWEMAPADGDALDEMISGIKNGTIREVDEGAQDRQHEEQTPKRSPEHDGDDQNTCVGADKFKCGQKSDADGSKGPNEWLAVKFDEMHDMYQGVEGKSSFAIWQYQRAASIMRRTQYPITSGPQALKIKGIGQGIADRIDEFISGSFGRQQYEDNEKVRVVAIFKDVYGVGRHFANELYKRGARTMDDLRTKDFGLTRGQLIGVDLYDDLNSRIPRDECRSIFEIVRAEAHAIDPKLWIEIMGSYRRGQETSGDVDLLITRDTADGLNHAGVLGRLVSVLKNKGIITHELSLPHDWKAMEAKWMGVCKVGPQGKYRRIDILCIPFEQWGAALIYFTGNEIFNRSLRLYARKKGYSLNQRGLSTGVIRDKAGLKLTEGEIIASRTEQEIFDVLGLRWRYPHHRRP